MTVSPEAAVALLNALPPELLLVAETLLCFSAILGMVRWFGAPGLYVYIAIAVIGANIQVLKVVEMPLYGGPVALGTVLFASTYLATDILAEHYGHAAARRGVMIGFAAFLLWTLVTLVTLGYAPLTPAQAGAEMEWALPMHDHMAALFQPVPILFVASMLSYLISQTHDVWAFERIRRMTAGRHLWLRNNGSTLVSALIDNVVFNVLAWIVLAPEPLGWSTVVWSYIVATYWMRAFVALADTPFMYLARFAVKDAPPARVYA